MDGAVVLKMQDICKSFPGVKVLDQVQRGRICECGWFTI